MSELKLYVTSTSPYARIVRILILEKGLSDAVEVIQAKTRSSNSPYYQINVSGRVPYLVHKDGWALEDSSEICAWLDSVDGNLSFIDPVLSLPEDQAGWQTRQLQARATSLLDGVSVWVREIRRAASDQSATIIEHERSRALRLANWWEQRVDDEKLQEPLNLLQATLYCSLDMENALPAFLWREGNPRLQAFYERLANYQSIQQSSPYSDRIKTSQ